ncbi:MAG: NADH:ubiquinone reductase (Na(+)-transporting) subunit F [Prevotellaceae bacterium]|jgi:Na+-transporting NADH:ubiquinone oxidoreductase subunit F|nr:NADH:ubiquinone reductase (Na(+)-transporting) subunit F [Prevotellaceae bacterium]
MMNILVLLMSLSVFLVVLLSLVAVLLYAKTKLLPQGDVQLTINDEKTLDVAPGATLLSTLGEHKIFLPSACGGGATCGQCKCRVLSGGGDILPTETGFFTRKQQQTKWRLACQVKVNDTMRIAIPEDILGIRKWPCEVISNRNVSTFIKEFKVKLPDGERLQFQSGGYIQIDIPPCEVDFKDIEIEPAFREDWDAMRIGDLKMKNTTPTCRAYSMANHPAEDTIIMLNIRLATPPWDKVKGVFTEVNPGVSSSYIFSRKPGDTVMIAGPYGEFFLRDTDREMMFIGGGAGMAPMHSHLFHLFHTLHTKRKVSFWYGARSRRELFYEDEFRALERQYPNFRFIIALSEPKPEDHWNGPVGFIHQVIYNTYLQHNDAPEDIEYYLCGPPLMTAAATTMLDNLGVPKEMILFDDFGG